MAALIATQKRRVSMPELKKMPELAAAADPVTAPGVASAPELKRVSSPSDAPSRLPVWKAALPIVIAEMTRITVNSFAAGLLKCARRASPRPLCEMIPSRAAISWRMIVAATENTIPQRRAYPKLAPARVQVVIVPGPMKAAVTRAPGPILNLGRLRGVCIT